MDSSGNETPSGGHSSTQSPTSKKDVPLSERFDILSQRPNRRILLHLLQEDEVQVGDLLEDLSAADASPSGTAEDTANL